MEGQLSGLSLPEIKKKQAQFGLNALPEKGYRNLAKIVLGQLANLLILILVAAAIVSFVVGNYIDFYILLAVVILNTAMGTILEYRAEKTLYALKKILPLEVNVIRKGRLQTIEAKQLVPDDIIQLEAGDQVPADAELITASEFRLDQSVLTGESVPVPKSPKQDKKIYSGTTVVSGHAQARVTLTGIRARIGKIADKISVQEESTPLQKRLFYLGKVLAVIVGIATAIIFLLGIWRGMELGEIFIYSISLLVSAVPESLPVVTTLALAIGVIRMSRHQAITRHLPALETLGTVNVIASDKTGTLTKNELTVKEVWLSSGNYLVEGSGYEPHGQIINNQGGITNIDNSPDLEEVIKTAAICNNAQLTQVNSVGDWQVIGDPIEGALLVLAKKAKLLSSVRDLDRFKELPFSSESKRMTVVIKDNNEFTAYSKGAPETMIKLCTQIKVDGRVTDFNEKLKQDWLNKAQQLAERGYRILAIAKNPINKFDHPEKNLIFLGLIAMIDPPLVEAAKSLREASALGLKTVIITGDHKLTAKWVVERMGIKVSEDEIMVGSQLDRTSPEELKELVKKVKVWARITPEQKQKIVRTMKDIGWSVAVTGDGVNDAPAMKEADVGIAMGKQGTDVARQAADLVLRNDRFSAIVAAIKYGRTIYDNIRKFFTFLLSGNFDEIMLVSIAFIFALPQPFTAAQILWINLVTDTFPALALAFEKPEDKNLGKPRDPRKGIIIPILRYALFIGMVFLLACLAVFLYFKDIDPVRLRTYIFTLAVVLELAVVFAIRSDKPFWKESPFKNKVLVLAVIISLILQLLAIYSPLNQILKTVPLNISEWGMIIGLSFVSYLIVEVVKSTKLRKLFKF